MAKDKENKTNAMRIIEGAGIPFVTHSYESGGQAVDGVTVAGKLGKSPDEIYKTLVTKGSGRDPYVFVVPAAAELDLKKAAKAAGDKNMEMVAVKELLALTGYIRGGCSPVGMKKKYPTHFDETCVLWEEIAVSAGARGHQMILPPEELARLVGAKLVDIIL